MKEEKQNKMAIAPMNKLFWKMGLPMIVSMVLQALYNVVDSIFVTNMGDKGAIANQALTFAFPIQIMIIAIGVGTGVGLNALLSKSLGENDKEKAIQYANVAIQDDPKRIVDKIKKDVTFAIIIAKLSIPFNLEVEEEKPHKLSKKELMAKKHLEETVEITKKIGFADLKISRNENKEINKKDKEKKREN